MLNSAEGVTLPCSKYPAHQHDPGQPPGDLRRLPQRQRDIGQRAERAERDRALGLPPHRLDDEIGGMTGLERHFRRRQIGAVEAGLAVHVLRRHQVARQRPVRAGEDPHVRPPGQFADLARVQRGQVERNIAGDAGDAENLQLRRGERQQDRHRVVLPRVGVDDDLHAAAPTPKTALANFG